MEVDESNQSYQTAATFAQNLKKTYFQKSSFYKKKLLKRVHLSTFSDYLSSNPSSCAKAKKMAPNTKMDIKWSSNKMEGGNVLKTMECLRRRLLAERQASLLAKEEAELMGKRSKELEKIITEQIQMRTKAEKRLQLLRKKLESHNLSSTVVNSEPSISSEKSRNARGSTISRSSAAEICCDKTKIENGGEEFDSLAIVAVNSPEKSETGELKPVISERIVEARQRKNSELDGDL